ncbi:hypothetical protein ACW2Q0_03050 [Nocardia sp. R16R-3T]
MTNDSVDEPNRDDINSTSEAMLNSGETEHWIAEARKTIAAAMTQGRLDIVEKAGAVINSLVEKHTALAAAHGNTLRAQAQLAEASAEYEAAKAQLLAEQAKEDR